MLARNTCRVDGNLPTALAPWFNTDLKKRLLEHMHWPREKESVYTQYLGSLLCHVCSITLFFPEKVQATEATIIVFPCLKHTLQCQAADFLNKKAVLQVRKYGNSTTSRHTWRSLNKWKTAGSFPIHYSNEKVCV